MLDRRRLLALVAVLFGLTALAATVTAPREPAAPPAAQRPSAEQDANPTPERGVRTRRLSADGAQETISARVGQVLRLEVSGDVIDTVVIAGLDRLEGIDPQSPARIEILPERPGTYEIALLDARRRIGTLEIRP